MKVYISLPITGKDIEEQKRHAGDVASFLLTAGQARRGRSLVPAHGWAHARQSVQQRA